MRRFSSLQASRQSLAVQRQRNGSFSVLEVCIGSVVLAVAMAASISLFNSYLVNSASARIQDEILSLITKDIETLRYRSSRLWLCSSGSTSTICVAASGRGGLSSTYDPPLEACRAQSLASAAAQADAQLAARSTTLQANVGTPQAATIQKTISQAGNLIKLDYQATKPLAVHHVAYILPTAQGWCP